MPSDSDSPESPKDKPDHYDSGGWHWAPGMPRPVDDSCSDATPEPPPHISHCCGEGGTHPDCPAPHAVAGGRTDVPATPEGGELGDLLAEADRVFHEAATPWKLRRTIRDLASALRRQSEYATEWPIERIAEYVHLADELAADNDRLERELAEARDTGVEVVTEGVAGESTPPELQPQAFSRVTIAQSPGTRVRVVVLRATAEEDSNDG